MVKYALVNVIIFIVYLITHEITSRKPGLVLIIFYVVPRNETDLKLNH